MFNELCEKITQFYHEMKCKWYTWLSVCQGCKTRQTLLVTTETMELYCVACVIEFNHNQVDLCLDVFLCSVCGRYFHQSVSDFTDTGKIRLPNRNRQVSLSRNRQVSLSHCMTCAHKTIPEAISCETDCMTIVDEIATRLREERLNSLDASTEPTRFQACLLALDQRFQANHFALDQRFQASLLDWNSEQNNRSDDQPIHSIDLN
jgi:hypothetical protein